MSSGDRTSLEHQHQQQQQQQKKTVVTVFDDVHD